MNNQQPKSSTLDKYINEKHSFTHTGEESKESKMGERRGVENSISLPCNMQNRVRRGKRTWQRDTNNACWVIAYDNQASVQKKNKGQVIEVKTVEYC